MTSSPAILVAFLQRCLDDELEGGLRPLQEYLALYPGHERAITEEYEKIATSGAAAAKTVAGPVPPAAEAPPAIGPFRLIGQLGAGGQGVVYEAEDTRLSRMVALKVLSGRWLDAPDAWKRLHREALLVSRLQHPGLCTVFEADTVDGISYIAMQRIEGESLAERIARDRASPSITRAQVLERCRVIGQASRAVAAAHAAGIVHRDLKPGNIMVTDGEQPVVLDFGLARDLEQDEVLTRTGDVFGTPAYLAPERLQHKGAQAGPAADQYALAVTLYEWLTGERPFRAATRELLYRAILEDAVPRARSREPAVPADLDVVLATAMAKQPSHRYTSVAAFADDLAAVVESRPIAASPPGPVTRIVRWVQRDPLRATLTASLLVLLLAAAGLGGYLLAQRDVIGEGQRAVEAQRLADRVMAALNRFGQVGSPSASEVRDALRAHPELRLPRAALVVAYLDLARLDDAAELLRQRPEGQRDDPAFLLLERELERRRAGSESPASVPYTAATDDVVEFVLGSIQLSLRRNNGGIECARRAARHLTRAVVKSARSEIVYHDQLARALLLADDVERYVDVSEAMVHLWPDSASSWARFALARRMGQDVEGCRDALLRSVARDDSDPQNAMMLSLVEIELGLLEESDRHFDQAMAVLRKLLPAAIPRQQAIRGRALLQYGHPAQAAAVLADLVEREPENEEAARLLRQARGALEAESGK